MKKLYLAGALVLAACGSTPKADIAALETGLTAADNIALAYVNLPSCLATATNPPLCSKPDTRTKIGTAAQQAYDAIKTAQAVVNTATSSSNDITKAVDAATQAVQGFSALAATLTVK